MPAQLLSSLVTVCWWQMLGTRGLLFATLAQSLFISGTNLASVSFSLEFCCLVAIAVSRDHKPNQTDERQRIEDAGGFVMWPGTWRVGGVFAVSRAFGDRQLKQYVVADPEIQEEKVNNTLEFLVLASDGLWDVVSNEEAVSMTKPILDPKAAAKRLLQEANQRGSADPVLGEPTRILQNQLQHKATERKCIGNESVDESA